MSMKEFVGVSSDFRIFLMGVTYVEQFAGKIVLAIAVLMRLIILFVPGLSSGLRGADQVHLGITDSWVDCNS